MAKDFFVEVLSSNKSLYQGKSSEVVLPAYDGEVGVLADHGDFIGLLGTGALKIVTSGNDYWFMLSKGVYHIENGKLIILAEQGDASAAVDISLVNSRIPELEEKLKDLNIFTTPEYKILKLEYDQLKAKQEVYKRTNVVN